MKKTSYIIRIPIHTNTLSLLGHMPRKKTIYSSKFPYHITSRSNHKEWFHCTMETVWKIAQDSLKIANTKFPVRVHAFVLMNNHYHMVLSTPEANISSFMYLFNKNFSLFLRKKTGLINRMFGGRYKWSLITNQIYYSHVLKYVFLNPNKANLVSDASLYPYSTLYIQKNQNPFPVDLKPFINTLDPNFLNWISEDHCLKQRESISKGLVRTNFKFCASRENRKRPDFDRWDKSAGT